MSLRSRDFFTLLEQKELVYVGQLKRQISLHLSVGQRLKGRALADKLSCRLQILTDIQKKKLFLVELDEYDSFELPGFESDPYYNDLLQMVNRS